MIFWAKSNSFGGVAPPDSSKPGKSGGMKLHAGVPWAVLSAGVDHETFIKQAEVAVANGARGAMAGRSLWKDSLAVSPEVREALLSSRALPRLRELAAVVDGAPA